MTGKRATVFAALLGAMVLGGCNTVSSALDGVGGVFMGAGQDVRSVGGL